MLFNCFVIFYTFSSRTLLFKKNKIPSIWSHSAINVITSTCRYYKKEEKKHSPSYRQAKIRGLDVLTPILKILNGKRCLPISAFQSMWYSTGLIAQQLTAGKKKGICNPTNLEASDWKRLLFNHSEINLLNSHQHLHISPY